MQISSSILETKSKHISIKFHHAPNEEKIQKTVKFEHNRYKEYLTNLPTNTLPKAICIYCHTPPLRHILRMGILTK
jgi:hypothetical protein